MINYKLPWRRDGARIIRKDGEAIIEGRSHHDPSCRGCRCSASTKALTESVDYAVSCANACAGIASPERLPSLIAALLADREAWARYDSLEKATATQDEILEACAKTAETRRKIDTALAAVMGETT